MLVTYTKLKTFKHVDSHKGGKHPANQDFCNSAYAELTLHLEKLKNI